MDDVFWEWVWAKQLTWQSSYSQLGNSGNSAISIKSKGLTNIKMYVEGKIFQKGKFKYNPTKYQVSVVQQV